MSWFKCSGGTGMPSGLQSEMDAVLNKKFNTSTTYPPADWPDDVNLLGVLEVKTASGAIASFSDGADDVPVKSCSVTFTPSGGGGTPSAPVAITGVSGLSVTQCPNMCNFNDYNVTAGTNTTVALGDDLTLKKGTYTLSFSISATVTATRNRPCYVINGNYTYADSDYKTSGRYSWTFTLADDTTLSIRWWAHTVSDNITISDFELNGGSVALPYAPYITPSVVTDTFGQTLYGGTRDLVTDKAEVTFSQEIDLSTLTWNMDNDTRFRSRQPDYLGSAGWSGDWSKTKANCFVCENPATSFSNRSDYSFSNIPQNYYNFDIKVPTGLFADVTAFKTWLADVDGNGTHAKLVIELATPTEITGLTSHNISTRLGDNNFYADTGTMSVEYRSSGTETIVSPTLITKSITANGTYQASSDNADGYSSVSVTVSANVGTKSITSNGTYTASSESLDGYSSVTVEVPPYSFMPAYTLTKIVDNSTQQSSFTFTEDYHNFSMLKIVLYNSSSQIYDNIYVLPSGIDKAFTYSSNHFCVNQQITGYSNIYVTYNQDSLLTWSRVANRNANIYEIYGMTFTNATMTTEVIYSRDALTSGNVTPTPPTGKNFFDYDAIIYMFNTTDANITAFSKWWLTKPKMSISTDAEGYGVPLFVYNNGKPVVMTETSIGTYNFFYVVGINFTAT